MNLGDKDNTIEVDWPPRPCDPQARGSTYAPIISCRLFSLSFRLEKPSCLLSFLRVLS